jgi:hypothetical protein
MKVILDMCDGITLAGNMKYLPWFMPIWDDLSNTEQTNDWISVQEIEFPLQYTSAYNWALTKVLKPLPSTRVMLRSWKLSSDRNIAIFHCNHLQMDIMEWLITEILVEQRDTKDIDHSWAQLDYSSKIVQIFIWASKFINVRKDFKTVMNINLK